jgi:C_GCAxxG_C_C family probable redox protein
MDRNKSFDSIYETYISNTSIYRPRQAGSSKGGEDMTSSVERTVDLFRNALNCSQAMLTVFGEPYGIDAGTAMKLGRPLGGGIGHMARTCGALTAAVLVLGMAKDDPEEREARQISHRSVQELFRRFEDRHGTTLCRDLLGADMSTEEGARKVREEKLVAKTCPLFVRDAAHILSELLEG